MVSLPTVRLDTPTILTPRRRAVDDLTGNAAYARLPTRIYGSLEAATDIACAVLSWARLPGSILVGVRGAGR
jgi:hypothetical protein